MTPFSPSYGKPISTDPGIKVPEAMLSYLEAWFTGKSEELGLGAYYGAVQFPFRRSTYDGKVPEISGFSKP